MKKLALFMLLSVTAPLFAVISDAQYAAEVQKIKNVNNPLIEFAVEGNLPVIQYLVEVKNMNPNTPNERGQTVLDYAVGARQTAVVEYLLEHGAQVEPHMIQGLRNQKFVSSDPAIDEILEILETYTSKANKL